MFKRSYECKMEKTTHIEKYFTVCMLSVAISEDFYIFDGTHNVYQAEGSCVVCNPACAVLNDNTLGLIVPQCATIYPQQPRIKTFWRVLQFLRRTSGGRDSGAGLGHNKGG